MRWILLGVSFAVLCGFVYVLLATLPSIPIIDRNREIAGALIAAAGTIFAANIAWVALTTQLDEQRTSTKIAARTYWQARRDSAEVVVSGLRLVLRTGNALKDAYERRDKTANYPAVEGLKLIQKTGVLDVSSFPPSGNELYAWDLNIHVTTLKVWWFRVGTGQNAQDLPDADKAITETAEAAIKLIDGIRAALARGEEDVTRANRTLQALDTD